MNLLCWNNIGALGRGFASLMKEICKEYNTNLSCIVDTYSGGDQFGFANSFIVDVGDQSGGI